ncbi:hypothetical protein Q5752_000944 [Cryptotrichosporon argae]
MAEYNEKAAKDDGHIGLTAKQTAAAAASNVDPELLAQGIELLHEEKSMGAARALKHHWRALAWSLFLSLALFMDGYDGAIINSFFALPAFKNKFGSEVDGAKIITANWQTALGLVGTPGNLAGLFFTGWAQERFGSRKTYLFGMALTSVIIFLMVFCQNLPMLAVAEALAAFAWAIFNTLTAAYAAEICPIHLRGYAASFISFCWGGGQFIAAGIERAALVIPGNWGWRMPFTLQWFWPALLFTGVIFAPESPWWLVRKGKYEEAKRVLTRNATPGYYDNRSLDGYIAYIKHTDDIEQAEARTGSFVDMFRGTNLRRTEIMAGVWAMQVWSGTAMTAYAVEMFEVAGMSTTTAFDLNLVVTGMNLIGCFIEFGLITFFGRRRLLLSGLSSLAFCLLMIGIMGAITSTSSTQRTAAAFMVMINLLYHASVGPLTYTIASEIPASRLRARSIASGRMFYAINYVVTTQLTPRMFPATSWNWGLRTAFFYLGANLIVLTWTFFRLPETRGFSFAELDILFANKVPTRKFTQVVIHDEAVPGADELDPTHAEAYDDKKAAIESQHVERV